ncbi:MAG: EamA family transporter [Clostridiales bacterium]|nr:EamA family transporter [Clostridiales bacterium]
MNFPLTRVSNTRFLCPTANCGRNSQSNTSITRRAWAFLCASGAATGLSWLFYFKALQIGEASKVVPIDKFSVVISMALAFVFLGEDVTAKTAIGGLLITAGMLAMIL